MTTLLIQTEHIPLTVNFPAIAQMTRAQFYEFCQANRDLRIERTATGEVIIMPPAFSILSDGSRTSRDLYLSYPDFNYFDNYAHRFGYTLNHEFNENWQIRNNLSISVVGFEAISTLWSLSPGSNRV